MPSKTILVQDLKDGDIVLSCSVSDYEPVTASVGYVGKHRVRNYVLINNRLGITANHEVLLKDRGWTFASEATIGDELMKAAGGWEIIRSLCLVEKSMTAYDIRITNTASLFVSGYLVHNDGKIKGG